MAHAILCISSSTVSVALGNLLGHEDQEIYRIVRTHIKLVVSNPYNSIKYTTGDIPLYNCFFHPFTVHVAASAPGRSPKKNQPQALAAQSEELQMDAKLRSTKTEVQTLQAPPPVLGGLGPPESVEAWKNLP